MRLRGLAAALGFALLGLLMLQAPAAYTTENEDLATMVEQAKTAADHEAIAARYDQLAAEAKKEAERHRKMEKSYAVGASTGRVGLTPMPQHCTAIAKRYEGMAAEYTAMAAAHREMAKSGK